MKLIRINHLPGAPRAPFEPLPVVRPPRRPNEAYITELNHEFTPHGLILDWRIEIGLGYQVVFGANGVFEFHRERKLVDTLAAKLYLDDECSVSANGKTIRGPGDVVSLYIPYKTEEFRSKLSEGTRKADDDIVTFKPTFWIEKTVAGERVGAIGELLEHLHH